MHLITGVSAENTNEGRVLKGSLACVASPIKSLARFDETQPLRQRYQYKGMPLTLR